MVRTWQWCQGWVWSIPGQGTKILQAVQPKKKKKCFLLLCRFCYLKHSPFFFLSQRKVVVQLLSCVRFFETPWTAACQASLSSPSLRVCSNSCPLSWWCYATISSSVVPFSCLQYFPASGSFPMSQFFASDEQSTGASASATVLPMNIQGWFPLGLTDLISLLSKGLSRVFSSTSLKESVLWRSAFFMVQLSHSYTTTGKTKASTIWTLVSKVMPLLFNTLSRCVTAFFQGTGIF